MPTSTKHLAPASRTVVLINKTVLTIFIMSTLESVDDQLNIYLNLLKEIVSTLLTEDIVCKAKELTENIKRP
jgi:small nuclear ribonucleoprotein (snRNP)-like protein